MSSGRLSQDFARRRTVVPRVVPRQLPADVRHFTGRRAELTDLDRLLHRQRAATSVIEGNAGVGKTALAIHWAHLAADRFPDGQLYADLQGFGHGGAPLTPSDVLRGFLEALGVPAGECPVLLADRTALYRAMLADRALLIILDNACDAAQVRPLLPAGSPSLAVITSRAELAGFAAAHGASRLVLDLFSEPEAAEFLARRLGSERVAAEERSCAELARLCHRHPLALSIVAARAAALPPGSPLAELTAELSEISRHSPAAGETRGRTRGNTSGSTRGNTSGSTRGNTSGSSEGHTGGNTGGNAVGNASAGIADVQAILSWSHRCLNPPAARLFRLLGLHPGPDISVPAAASLAGSSAPRARRMLDELTRAGLLHEQSPGRLTSHDLLRAYAAELARSPERAVNETAAGETTADETTADETTTGETDRTTTDDSAADERRAAIRRMLDHYLHTAHAASSLLAPARPALPLAPPAAGAVPEEFASRQDAFAWLSAQRATLIALTAQAAELGFDSHAWQLPWALATFLDMQGWWSDWARTQRIALAAAQRLADVPGQAHANRSIGCAYMRLESPQSARTHLRRAARLFDQLNDPVAVARCRLNIAHTFEQQHRYHEALRNAVNALSLMQASDDLRGQASALNAIGWCQLRLGQYQRALSSCQQALGMHCELGDRRGEAAALDSIGYAHHRLGQHSSAITCCGRAADLSRDLGDREAETEALVHLGDAQLGAGNAEAAQTTWRQALGIIAELGLPRADEVQTKLRYLGTARGGLSAEAVAAGDRDVRLPQASR